MATITRAAGRAGTAAARNSKPGRAVSRLSVAERIARGKAARKEVPRARHALFEPLSTRADPVELLERQATTFAQFAARTASDADTKESTVCTLMNARRERNSREGPWHTWLRVPVVMFVAVALIVVAGCGGSSKPAYCSDRSNLENSVKGLTSAASSAASSGDISGIKSQITKIQSDATSLVSAAKDDFPSETSAVKSSVATLQSAVTALPPSPSTAQIAAIGKSAAGVVSSVKSFSDASKSKCS